MGILDELMKQATGGQQAASPLAGLMDMVAKNPQIVAAVVGLVSSRDATVGGNGGLGGLVSALQGKGLGDIVSSWIAKGPNQQISASQLGEVLGNDTLGQFARRAGVSAGQSGSVLAGLLPVLVDYLTPDGKVPAADSLENSLSSILSGLQR